MLESKFQKNVIDKITDQYPGCMILKVDTFFHPGVPDRLILFEDKWASLEFKRSRTAKTQPNQPYYVDLLNHMSFSAFIYPENEEEVLYELQCALLRPRRSTRVP